jgi:hypothetical protein
VLQQTMLNKTYRLEHDSSQEVTTPKVHINAGLDLLRYGISRLPPLNSHQLYRP